MSVFAPANRSPETDGVSRVSKLLTDANLHMRFGTVLVAQVLKAFSTFLLRSAY